MTFNLSLMRRQLSSPCFSRLKPSRFTIWRIAYSRCMLSLPLRSAPTVQHHFAGASIAHTGIIVLEYVSTAGAVNEVSLHKAINLASGSHRTSAYLCHKPDSMQLRCCL